MPGPIFKHGDRVDLHTVEREDIDFLHRNYNRPEVRHWMPSVHPRNREQVEERIEDTDEDDTTLLGCVDGEPVGSISLFDFQHASGKARIGAWVDPEYHGEGYGTEMTELTLEYAFDERRLHRLTAGALETNDPSRSLLESVGFEEEGRLRDGYYVQGEYVDRMLYGLLESEWPA